METGIHRLVEHAEDLHDVAHDAEQHDMAGPDDASRAGADVIPAEREMPRPHAVSELRSISHARPRRIAGDVRERREQELLVSVPNGAAELRVRPDEDVEDVRALAFSPTS